MGLSLSPRRPGFWFASAGVAAFSALMNSLSTGHDLERRGIAFHPLEPLAWEASSALATLTLLPALAWLVERRPWSQRPRRLTAVLYLLGAGAFSALHVAGMVLLRKLVYALAWGAYRFGSLASEFLYELRKDLVTFAIIVTILNLLREIERRLAAPVLAAVAAAPAAAAESGAPAGSVAIRDGTREVEIDCRSILAVRAAGNYVEVFRAGERPLMLRATLAEVEARLAAAGLARVHRSWLIALAQVEALTPSGSGDFRARLRDGSEVPVSRRYKDAVQRLRPQAPA